MSRIIIQAARQPEDKRFIVVCEARRLPKPYKLYGTRWSNFDHPEIWCNVPSVPITHKAACF